MKRRILAWTLVILWCMVIFNFSAEDREASRDRSRAVTQRLDNIMTLVLDSEIIDIPLERSGEHYVRKAAHIIVYFILTVFVFNALVFSRVSRYKIYLFSFLIPITYGIFDEFHQSYVPGRGPMVRDVFIDGVGVLTGILFCHIYLRLQRSPKR